MKLLKHIWENEKIMALTHAWGPACGLELGFIKPLNSFFLSLKGNQQIFAAQHSRASHPRAIDHFAFCCNLQIDASSLIAASVMAAPCALAMSKLSYPETEESSFKSDETINVSCGCVNVAVSPLYSLKFGILPIF